MNVAMMSRLKRLDALSSLAPARLENLSAVMTFRDVKKGIAIFRANEAATVAYLQVSGMNKVILSNYGNEDVFVRLISTGEFFGSSALTSQPIHPYRCEAHTDSVVGVISPQALVEVFLDVPFERYLSFADAVVTPIWKMYIHCTRAIGLDLRQRLAIELLELAARFGLQNDHGILIRLGISQSQLADLTRASRQRISLLLSEFEREKIIIREGRRLIVKPHQLARVIERKRLFKPRS